MKLDRIGLYLRIAIIVVIAVAFFVFHALAPARSQTPAPAGDPARGAKLVQQNGCEGCHGAGLQGGGIGPRLYGVEHKLSPAGITQAIKQPTPPMPDFGFTDAQVADLVAYVSSLDGGADQSKPVVTFTPESPNDEATITVRFPGTPPKSVAVLPSMQMGHSSMSGDRVELMPSASDPHVFTGKVKFSMGGPWTVRITYDGKNLDVPLTVGSGGGGM